MKRQIDQLDAGIWARPGEKVSCAAGMTALPPRP